MEDSPFEPMDPSLPETPRDAQEARPVPAPFSAVLERCTPRVWVTQVLIGINAAVFLAMVLSGVHVLTPTIESLLRWGADYAPKVGAGQWWRLFTSMFLHIGIIHILFNMVVLWSIGRFVERLAGNPGFLAVYLISGLAGSVASIWWNPMIVSAGASGAIFGLYGYLLGFLLRNRDTIPPAELQKLMRSALVFVGYNLVFGASQKGIDMAAHLGGLLGGFACALAASRPLTLEGLAARTRSALAAGMVGLVLLLGVAAALPKVPDFQAEMAQFGRMESKVIDAFNQSANRNQARQLSDDAFARVIESEILPPWKQSREHLLQLKGLPKPQADLLAHLCGYMAAREESWTLLDQALRANDLSLAKASHQRELQAEQLLKELKAFG